MTILALPLELAVGILTAGLTQNDSPNENHYGQDKQVSLSYHGTTLSDFISFP